MEEEIIKVGQPIGERVEQLEAHARKLNGLVELLLSKQFITAEQAAEFIFVVVGEE